MPRKLRIDMMDVRHGRLVGVAFSHTSPSGRAQWLFACDCGAEVVADGGNVRSGSTASCGCLHREISAARLTTHARRASQRHDPTYRAWQEIKRFCSNPASPSYRDFGAQGIAVCPRWTRDFAAFLRDVGERPVGTKLARLDDRGDFTSTNCAWVPVTSRSERALAGHRRIDAAATYRLPVSRRAPAASISPH